MNHSKPSLPSPTVKLTVNGDLRELEAGLSVAHLLTAEGLFNRRVAVERNGEIVPRSAHGQTCLLDGDRIEIVAAVGGG